MKKIKPVIQKDLKDCGICCMQWLINYYDGYISLERLREDTCTDINGTSAYHIVFAFQKYGFDAMGVLEKDLQSPDLFFPLIAHLHLNNGLEHFVIIKNITNNIIYIMDPGVGDKKYNITDFNKLFTGHLIIAYPKDKIIKMDKDLNIKELFLKIIYKEKSLLIKIIISSILFTILIIINSYYLKIGSNLLNEDMSILKYLIFCFGIITFFKVIIYYIREYYNNHLSNSVDVLIYPEFIRHLFFLPLKSIRSRTTGEIITRISELGSIKNLFSEIFVTCFLDSIMLLVSLVILYIINEKLLFILLLFIVIYILYGFFVSKMIYHKIKENINYQTDFNSIIIDSISMFESVKNLNIINIILNKIEKSLSKYLLSNYEFTEFFNKTNLVKELLLESSYYIINSYGLWLVYQGNLSIIDLFTFNIVFSYCLEPVKNIINLLPKYNYVKATFSKISDFINLEEESFKDPSISLEGDIVLKGVSFSYNNYDYVLKDYDLIIKSNSHVLLNGKSGNGKSTICKLIYKTLDLNKGSISIGNNNLQDVSLASIRKSILYVSQNEEIFTGSIKDNILIGRDIANDLFMNICKICHVDEIVLKKKMRYDSIIDGTTKNLSGGEKQRIILARGLLKNANIIILDEALSEVDYKLESKIIKELRSFYKDKTIIYISHKNQTKNFENIVEVI